MKRGIPEFEVCVTNVYRTERFIVRQVAGILRVGKWNAVKFSYDTFYKRTPERIRRTNFCFRGGSA